MCTPFAERMCTPFAETVCTPCKLSQCSDELWSVSTHFGVISAPPDTFFISAGTPNATNSPAQSQQHQQCHSQVSKTAVSVWKTSVVSGIQSTPHASVIVRPTVLSDIVSIQVVSGIIPTVMSGIVTSSLLSYIIMNSCSPVLRTPLMSYKRN